MFKQQILKLSSRDGDATRRAKSSPGLRKFAIRDRPFICADPKTLWLLTTSVVKILASYNPPMHIRNHDLGEPGTGVEGTVRMPREYSGDIILLKS